MDPLREVSGATVLEIQTPTGYNILESDALEIIQENVHPTLRDARILEGKTYWFFDFVSSCTGKILPYAPANAHLNFSLAHLRSKKKRAVSTTQLEGGTQWPI